MELYSVSNIVEDVIKIFNESFDIILENPIICFSFGFCIFSIIFKIIINLAFDVSYSSTQSLLDSHYNDLVSEEVEVEEEYEGPIDMVILDSKSEKKTDYGYELLELKCDNCGALLDKEIIDNGHCKCNYCGTSYLLNRKKV